MPRVTTPSGLTPRQQQFVAEYLIDSNGTRAAIAVGYKPSSAGKMASDLLAENPKIRAAVAAGKKRIAAKLELTAEKVLRRITEIADQAEAEGKWSDALRGQELLGKHLRLFTDKQEISGPNGEPLQISRVERVIVDPAKIP